MTRPPRQTAITLLERTLTDFDYQPQTWTGALVRKQGKAGEGPTMRVPCPTCKRTGRMRVRGVELPCDRCLSVATGRPLGWVVVDSYTGREIGTEETGLVARDRWVRCDSCGGPQLRPDAEGFKLLPGMQPNGQACRHCDDSGRPGWVRAPERPMRPWRTATAPLSVEADTFAAGDPVLACMERRELAGSYEELGLALAALRLERKQTYRLNVSVFVLAEREESELNLYERLLLDESLAYLDSLMPEEVRVPSWAAGYAERKPWLRARSQGAAA